MSNPVTEIEGVVSAVRQRADNYGVKVGDDWYGGFGQCPVREGSRVAVKFYEKDGWKNLTSIRLLETEEPELDDAELAELFEKVRQQNYRIAAENVQDMKRLLAESGLRNAVSAQNVVRLAAPLTERRTLHISRVIDDYKRKKRLIRRLAPQNPAQDQQDFLEVGDG